MAPPPGSSYVVSNAFSRASRRALGLRDPIRIQFRQGWGPGNPLFQWYEECFKHPDSKMVRAIQLRKERLYPFFHEYIVFICRDGSRYRIDRRQLPDENVPLDSVYSHGVEAYDTVEEISPYHDKLYSTSDCLVEVEFRELDILFIIRICWAIHRHKSARLYTLQRYNCYFFAHTILTCATRSACEWYVSTCTGRNDKLSSTWSQAGSCYSLRSHGSVSSFGATGFKDYIDSFSSSSDLSSRYSSSSSIGSSACHSEVADINLPLPAPDHRQLDTDSEGEQQPSTLANLLPLITGPLYYRLATDKTFWLPLQQLDSLGPSVQLKFDWTNAFEQFSELDQSPHRLYARHLDRRGIYPGLLSVHTRLCKLLAKFESSLKNCWAELVSVILERIGSGTHDCEYGVSVGLWHEDDNIPGQLHYAVHRLIKLQEKYGREFWIDIVSTRLGELFMALEDLQLVHNTWPPSSYMFVRGSHPYSYAHNKELACQTWVTSVLVVFDLEFEKLDKALRRQIADTWGKSLRSSLEERTGAFRKRVRITMTKMPLCKLPRRRFFTHTMARGTDTLQDSTHIEMQNLVGQLIKSHSIRVEQYRRWLKCTANRVEADIKATMDEIWDEITTRASCIICGGIHPFNLNPESVY